MPRLTLIISMTIICSFAPGELHAEEMSLQDKITSAMSAAPARISDNATIQDSDGTVLKEGTNGWVCIPGGPKGTTKFPMCNDKVFMKWMATVWSDKPFSTDEIGYSYMLAGGYAANFKNPKASGDEATDKYFEGPHMMLILPDRSTRNMLPDNPSDGGIFVLWKDTPMELVIIPIGDRD